MSPRRRIGVFGKEEVYSGGAFDSEGMEDEGKDEDEERGDDDGDGDERCVDSDYVDEDGGI